MGEMTIVWDRLIVAAGIAQLGIVAASTAIPRILRWPEDLEKLRPLTRQVFWVYAGYIWCTNLAFGALSAAAPRWLCDDKPLAGAVSAYIAVYWGARLVIQFAYFDRSDMPRGAILRIGEAVLVALFLLLAIVYGTLALRAGGMIAR
jgi:hypothetical protein